MDINMHLRFFLWVRKLRLGRNAAHIPVQLAEAGFFESASLSAHQNATVRFSVDGFEQAVAATPPTWATQVLMGLPLTLAGSSLLAFFRIESSTAAWSAFRLC